MDELTEQLAGYQVTERPNSTAAEHPRFALYKAKASASSQEERRRKFLEAQKNKRFDYANHARQLASNEWDEEEEEDNDDVEEMDVDLIRKPSRSYKNQLMLSEWLVEVPPDLASEWYMVLCPVGKRCLVVSSRGWAKVYAKSGYYLKSFPSKLPGGNKGERNRLHSYCLLDCIFNEVENTYYVLDVMCWNSHPCFDSDTEFRFFWLETKFAEFPDLDKVGSTNSYKFVRLPYYSCDAESLRSVMWSPLPFSPNLDGVLLYHKRTHYTCGSTPLVGWLKAYMFPEILNIDVPPNLTLDKPASYTTMANHIPEEFKKLAKRKEEEEKCMQYETA